MTKDKQLVEQWWINLYDSIMPSKVRLKYLKKKMREKRKCQIKKPAHTIV